MIDHASEPGAWAEALKAPCTFRKVSDYPSEAHPTLPLAGNFGAAESNPFAAPVLSGDNLLHTER